MKWGTEPFIAWRGWAVKEIEGTELLVTWAGTQSFIWRPGARAEAVCAKNNPVPCSEKCAGYGHGCGFYAAKDRRSVPVPVATSPVHVVGTVKMWGVVIEHEFGYRGQFAYPNALRAVRTTTPYRRRKGLLERLSLTYGLEW